MGIRDLNAHTIGLPTRLSDVNGLMVCKCDACPTRSHVSHDIHMIQN
jgi:hypothetical protein